MTRVVLQPAPAAPPRGDVPRQGVLAALAVVPVLATVYQTLVLTDVTADLIRKGIEGDSYRMLWTNLTWGVAIVYGAFLAIWAMPRFGARDAIAAGLGLFAAGNLLCGSAVDVPSMAAAKAVEGLGKGMTIALCRATLYRQFDRAVVVAIGFYSLATYSTRHATPLVTALISDRLSWRWIFWVNVPIALLGLALVRLVFRPDRPPSPRRLQIDWLAVTLFCVWVSCLLFTFGWYRRWGGWTSNTFAATATLSAVLPVVLALWVGSGLTPDEHLRRIVRVRTYVLAMCVRALMLLHFSAVLTIMGKYLTDLRDYPREAAGWIMAPASLTMAASTFLTTRFRRRSLRHAWLLVGVLGGAACLWWLSTIDDFTPKGDIALIHACWGLFLGLFPPVFLADEVEGLDPKDALYGGAIGIVCLVTALLVVPLATSTAISEWTDRVLDVERLNLREERPAVREAQARVADDFRQRGLAGPELSSATSDVLGGFVKAESVSRGIQDGLKFLALVLLGLGLVTTALLARSPLPFPVIADPGPRRRGNP